MLRTKPVDMTKGALLSSIAIYAFPIMLASLVQTLFNAADLAVLGNFSSTVSVAAVGATGPIVGLLVTSVIGLSNGTNVILSRAIGAGHTARAQRVVGSTVVLALAVGVLFGVIGIVCAPWMLTVTDCDASYMADAQLYLTLYFIGILLYKTEIGNNNINSRHFFIGKGHSAVNKEHITVIFINGYILSYLT